MKELDEQTQKLRAAQAKQAELLQRYQDKKFIQEEMKRKTANVVNDQLTKFSPAIKDAQSDMTKTKKVYESSTLVPDTGHSTNVYRIGKLISVIGVELW